MIVSVFYLDDCDKSIKGEFEECEIAGKDKIIIQSQ